MLDALHKIIYTGIGLAVLTEKKAQEVVDDLVKKGEVSAEEGQKLVREMMDKARYHAEEVRKTVNEEVRKVSDRYRWPSRQEFDELKRRVAELERRVPPIPLPGETVRVAPTADEQENPVNLP